MPFVKRANTHQTHFEDLVLLGPDGLEELNDKIEGTIDTLENNSERLNLTTKIDGAPAVICWSKFEGYPDNSCCLKSAFDAKKNKKICSTPQDVDLYYGDTPERAEMLKDCLVICPSIPAGEAWQGDCLFVSNTKKVEKINGKEYLTFMPNKIIYAFSEDNPGYDDVKKASFGIAFHTIYKGNGENRQQSFKVDTSKLNTPDDFYIMSPALNIPTDKKVFNLDKVKSQFDRLEDLEQKLLSDYDYEDLINNSLFREYWDTFENNSLADKKAITINENTFIEELKDFIKNVRGPEKLASKVKKLKTEKGIANATENYNQEILELEEVIDKNRELLVKLVQTLNCAATIKMLLWQGFKQTQFDYNTFYRSRTKGYLPGEMEGVAMSDQDGNIVKIVDRSTFSSYNRDPDIMSGFEHPENLTTEQLSFKESYNDELVECGIQQLWEKFNRLLESEQKTAVVAFGRMNPPTIGHQKLVDTMASLATGEKAKLFLSHTQDKKKNPLSYEQKIRYAKEAFEPKIDVVESPARTIIEVLRDLYSDGYTDIIYVGGEDRIGGVDDTSGLIMRYNGQPDKSGNIPYDFNSIKFKSAGGGDEGGDRKKFTYEYVKQNLDKLNLEEIASASLVRECVKRGDFELFKKLVPFNEVDAEALFNEIRSFYKDNGLLGESLLTEENNPSISVFRNWLKPYLDPKLIQMENSRHSSAELFRLKTNTENLSYEDKEEEIKNLVTKSINNASSNLPTQLKNILLNNVNIIGYSNYSGEANTSGKYKDFKIEFIYQDDQGDSKKDYYYICVNPGEVKSMIPSKVMEKINNVNYKSMYKFVSPKAPNREILVKILQEASSSSNVSYRGTVKDNLLNKGSFEILFKTRDSDVLELIKSNRSFTIDFAEVLGSVVLANAVSQDIHNEDTLISFPTGSNAELLDYVLHNSNSILGPELKISAKTGMGGAPSSGSLINSIVEYYSDNNVPEEYKSGYDFCVWAEKNITRNSGEDRVNTHTGFINLSKELISIISGNRDSWSNLLKIDQNDINVIRSIYNFKLNNYNDIVKLYDLTNGLRINDNFGKLRKSIYDMAEKTGHLEKYLESVKYKILSTIMVNYINDSDKLMDDINNLFRIAYGTLIQIHLVDDNDIIEGNFKFYTQTTQTDNYRFLQNTGISSKDFTMNNQRLAMRLK